MDQNRKVDNIISKDADSNPIEKGDINRCIKDLKSFTSSTAQEKADKVLFISLMQQHGAELLHRSCPEHVTVSSIILNPSMDAMLMVYHNIYDSYSWTGGHADGAIDFMGKALEEAKEETGVEIIYPYTTSILSLDILPVIAHQKNGKDIAAHHHLNVAFGFIAPDRQKLQVKPDENSDVRWISLENWKDACKEKHMIPVYEKIIARMLHLKSIKEDVYLQLPGILLPWFQQNGRDLPWRKTDNPYHIWLSEIMLQQTRVEAVKGYYTRFLNRLPDIFSLADADSETVLKLWEGLGYYSRAVNLQKAATEIVERHGGVFPSDYNDIRNLSGIGDYTAGAISSVCFGATKAAVDGNVLRVISRLTEDFRPVTDMTVKKEYTQMLERYYPSTEVFGDDARWYNQSLMELGATVCLPNGTPKCEICPVTFLCFSRKQGTMMDLPKKKEKAKRKTVQKTVFLFHKVVGESNENRIVKTAIQKRPDNGLLAGLWQLPNVDGQLSPQQALDLAVKWGVSPIEIREEKSGKHVFTHLEWHMKCYVILCNDVERAEGAVPDVPLIWKTQDELEQDTALPTAFRMFL